MKAKEYFEKYEEQIMKDFGARGFNGFSGITDMLQEFFKEAIALAEQRHVKTDSGSIAILKEFNDKWNAVGRLFEKRYNGINPLREDGFKHAVLNLHPEWKEFW